MTEEMNTKFLMYASEDGTTKIDVLFHNGAVWLSQAQMAELFGKNKSTISRHIRNILSEGELDVNSVVAKKATTASDGKIYQVEYYNLDMIFAVGYRVKSLRGIQFRQWATSVLGAYVQKGFVLNDERLKDPEQSDYWEQLLDRIRDIRTSEKRFYAKILEIFSTSVDYDPKSPETRQFFQLVQNKLHFAVTGHTASEIVFSRVSADKRNVGLTNIKGDYPTKKETEIAKNYLNESELRDLNQMTSAYLDIAERRARNKSPMHMKDWIAQVDQYIDLNQDPKLQGNGSVSHDTAIQKAHIEYERYRIEHPRISEIEKDYLEYLDEEVRHLKDKL
jgi:hypothetical protein